MKYLWAIVGFFIGFLISDGIMSYCYDSPTLTERAFCRVFSNDGRQIDQTKFPKD